MRSRWVGVARGDEAADLVLTGGKVLSVFTGEVFEANVAVCNGHVVGVGDYEGPTTYDVAGSVLAPGFIDGHCHIESSKLTPNEFARTVVSSGTTSVVVDPHELANVLGEAGIEFMLQASENLPLGVYVMIPSCVPASPFETCFQPLAASSFAAFLGHDRVIGIAEMMNYPAAIAGDAEVLQKMATTGYRHIDGHAPGVTGRALNAYLMSGPGSDHECTSAAEALEKKRLGMWIMIREASMVRNLVDLLPAVQQGGTENCMFVTDDREAGTLLVEGHVNAMVRKAVEHGLPAADAVRLATLNVARYHGLHDLGAVAPGYAADILVLDDLRTFEPRAVFKAGRLVSEAGKTVPFQAGSVPRRVTGTVNIAPISDAAFRIAAQGETLIRVIELVPEQVVTRSSSARPVVQGGEIAASPAADLAKVAVVERHHATGRVGTGFVRGFGLQRGAFASTVAHDAHNIVVVGLCDGDMALCVERAAQLGGGLVVAADGEILGELPLEVAGLMSTKSAHAVADGLSRLEGTLRTLGVRLDTPFMYLSFLALSVIPELRITDQGLVDVEHFALVPLGVA